MEDLPMTQTPPAANDKSQAAQLITALSIAFAQTSAGFTEKADPAQGAAALVHIQGMFLASMPDYRTRKFWRKSMESFLSVTIARMLAEQERQEKANG